MQCALYPKCVYLKPLKPVSRTGYEERDEHKLKCTALFCQCPIILQRKYRHIKWYDNQL